VRKDLVWRGTWRGYKGYGYETGLRNERRGVERSLTRGACSWSWSSAVRLKFIQ